MPVPQSGVPPHCLQTYSNFPVSLTLPAFTFTRICPFGTRSWHPINHRTVLGLYAKQAARPLSFHRSQLSALALALALARLPFDVFDGLLSYYERPVLCSVHFISPRERLLVRWEHSPGHQRHTR